MIQRSAPAPSQPCSKIRSRCLPISWSLRSSFFNLGFYHRSLAARPEVILFDEPCSALDPISTAKIENLIDELSKDYTIAIVTHNMEQAARVSNFAACMYLGELL